MPQVPQEDQILELEGGAIPRELTPLGILKLGILKLGILKLVPRMMVDPTQCQGGFSFQPQLIHLC